MFMHVLRRGVVGLSKLNIKMANDARALAFIQATETLPNDIQRIIWDQASTPSITVSRRMQGFMDRWAMRKHGYGVALPGSKRVYSL